MTQSEMISPNEILKKYWGYDAFREQQLEIIQSLLEGNDTLALLPTGGGKSVCFQVPAMCLEGMCIVVCPLIALMKDQVYQLRKRGILATAIYSGMSKTEIDHTLDNCIYGTYKFLYVSPERLDTELFKARVVKMNVNAIAIDEAHCISQWGYDFRPAYMQINTLRALLDGVPLIALTASATDKVVEDIIEKLEMQQPFVFKKSFYRSNLSYVVYNENDKINRLVKIVKKVNGSGVVYMRNRKMTEQIALALNTHGISADYYHAGLSMDERSKKQESWIDNKTQIIVATNAFGMGIDKSNVRIVAHLSPPDSLEEYYQEAGRGGRDEQLAYAVMLFNNQDIEAIEKKKLQAKITIKDIINTYNSICNFLNIGVESGANTSFDFDIQKFAINYKQESNRLMTIIKLQEQASLYRFDDSNFSPTRFKILVSDADVYKFMVANKATENLIKSLLRLYPGVYTKYVKINVAELVAYLKTSKEEVIRKLNFLHNNGIIDFYLNNQLPQLHFILPRLHENNISLDYKSIEWQLRRKQERLNLMQDYTTQLTLCRSNTILHYFNEKSIKICGKCDVCILQKQAKYHKEITQNIIVNLKTKYPTQFTLEQALDDASKLHETMIIEHLRQLCDESKLLKKGVYFSWK